MGLNELQETILGKLCLLYSFLWLINVYLERFVCLLAITIGAGMYEPFLSGASRCPQCIRQRGYKGGN